jgi:hypothetical protein
MSTIPYTHWSNFEVREDADDCAVELNELGLLVRIDESAYDGPDSGGRWLLRASWDVEVGHLVETHDWIQAVVERHGGG